MNAARAQAAHLWYMLFVAKDHKPKKTQSTDLVLAHSRTADGTGINVLRSREDRLELGTMRPLQEGKPLQGEVVKLTPREDCPVLFDAETLIEAKPVPASAKSSAQQHKALPGGGRSGPPQVASKAYRSNWDAVYKRRSKAKLLN